MGGKAGQQQDTQQQQPAPSFNFGGQNPFGAQYQQQMQQANALRQQQMTATPPQQPGVVQTPPSGDTMTATPPPRTPEMFNNSPGGNVSGNGGFVTPPRPNDPVIPDDSDYAPKTDTLDRMAPLQPPIQPNDKPDLTGTTINQPAVPEDQQPDSGNCPTCGKPW